MGLLKGVYVAAIKEGCASSKTLSPIISSWSFGLQPTSSQRCIVFWDEVEFDVWRQSVVVGAKQSVEVQSEV